ncbi:MAG: hypothetical protein LBM73_02820 [Candidatus Nomurabacteria bacterium]|nr:hypothetical protein [Candidatus Nomurabacteria bacterium]
MIRLHSRRWGAATWKKFQRDKWRRQNLVLAAAGVLVIVGLSIGWSVLSSQIKVSGSAQIVAPAKKSKTIEITDVSTDWKAYQTSGCGYDNSPASWTGNVFSVDGHFNSTGFCDALTTLTVQNNTDQTATLKSINTLSNSNTSVFGAIGTGASGVIQSGGTLAAGASGKVDVVYIFYGGSKQDFIIRQQLVWDVATPPIIIVSDGVLSYQIARGATLDLDSKISAIDYNSNDITSSLVKTCTFNGAATTCPSDQFASSAAGTWKITYNVSADGLAATPVVITVVIT